MKIQSHNISRALSARAFTRGFLLFVTIGTAAACAKKEQAAGSETAAAVPEPAPANPATSAQPSVTEMGYDKLRAGMTFTEANAALNGALKPAAGANLAECDYVTWEGGPKGLLVMVLENKIARVDITEGSAVTTDAGAKIGDTEDQVKSLYGARVSVSPHKYDDGNYLRVKSTNAADTSHVIVFETVKGKVTRFRAGVTPGVDFVEGCS